MQDVVSRHWACGTEVVEHLPDGCDLTEGVVLTCPRCRDAWWHYPNGAENGASPGAEASTMAAVPSALTPVAAPASAPPPAPVPAPGPSGRARDWLGPVLIVAGVVVVVLRLADIGRQDSPGSGAADASPPAERAPQAPPRPSAPRPADTPEIAPEPVVAVAAVPAHLRPTAEVTGSSFTLRHPQSWQSFALEGATAVGPSPAARLTVRVHVASQPGLTLERMGARAAATLRARLPGARVGRPRTYTLSGEPGLRVVARRGATRWEWVVLGSGSRRYLIELRADRGTSPLGLAVARAVRRTFRTVP